MLQGLQLVCTIIGLAVIVVKAGDDCDLDLCPTDSFARCVASTDSFGEARCICPDGFQIWKDSTHPTCVPCLQKDTSLFGDNLITLSQSTLVWSQCRRECQKLTRCQFWTFDIARKKCYLKHGRGVEYNNAKGFFSGTRNDCANHPGSLVVPMDQTTGSASRRSRSSMESSASSSSSPQLQVLHRNGGKSIYKALPAIFGAKIDREFALDSFATFVYPRDGCNLPLEVDSWSDKKSRIAILDRGDCKFVTKAKNAQREGFVGVIILDNQSHTGFQRITGDDSSIRIPVIFLLKNEADQLRAVMSFEGVARVLIQSSDSATSNPAFDHESTVSFHSAVRSSASLEEILRLRPMRPHVDYHGQNLSPPLSSMLDRNNKVVNLTNILQDGKRSNRDKDDHSLEFSPVMITFFIVAAGLILAIVVTLTIYVYHCRRAADRRRHQRTRCQRALAEMDAHYKRQKWDVLGSGHQDGQTRATDNLYLDIGQAAKVLECPVCLETAWPPKKIYQCMQGHILCEVCRSHPQLVSCPMCRQVMNSRLVSRNLALESLAVNLMQQKKAILAARSAASSTSAKPSAPSLDDLSIESGGDVIRAHVVEVHQNNGNEDQEMSSYTDDADNARDNDDDDGDDELQENSSTTTSVPEEIEDSAAVETHADNAPLTVMLPPEDDRN